MATRLHHQHGFRSSHIPLVYPVETKYEAKRATYYCHWLVTWCHVSYKAEQLFYALGANINCSAGVCGIVRAIDLQAIAGKSDYTCTHISLSA